MTANANHSNDLQNSDFNMKHRLTGAGLLISLAVVILPWLLGSYSISGEGDVVIQSVEEQQSEESGPSTADNSILITDDSDIKVFVSKIKPVDSKGRQIYTAKKASAKDVDTDKKASTKKVAADDEKKPLKTESDKKEKPTAEKKPKQETTQKVAKIDKPNASSKKPEAQKEVEQGYIVSVGVYLKKEGASRVLSDLKKKGFKPSSSESKSTKGLATRVWLGPFPTRAAAGKERSKLEQVIGEKGWIIRYP